MNLESLRYLYLRRIVAPILGALGLDFSLSLARLLSRGVFNLNTPGRRIAESRLLAAFSLLRESRVGWHGLAATSPCSAPSPRPSTSARGLRLEQQARAASPGYLPPKWQVPHSWPLVRESLVRESLLAPALVAAMYDHLARFWVEALFAKRLLRDSSWQKFVRVENESSLRGLEASGRGCVLATAYYGNPAIAALALGQIFRPVHVIVDVLAEPRLQAWQKELYAHRWVRPITRSEAARAVPDVLRRGGAVLMICEHERPRGPSVPASFLGRTLSCYPTLGRLTRWFDVPIGVVTCRREESGPLSFVLELHEVIEAGAQPRDALLCESRLDVGEADAELEPAPAESLIRSEVQDDAAVVRHVLSVLETEIKARPEQYYWCMPTTETKVPRPLVETQSSCLAATV